MKNLELFEIDCAIEWLLVKQCELIKQQDFLGREMRHLEHRRHELEQQKQALLDKESHE